MSERSQSEAVVTSDNEGEVEGSEDGAGGKNAWKKKFGNEDVGFNAIKGARR